MRAFATGHLAVPPSGTAFEKAVTVATSTAAIVIAGGLFITVAVSLLVRRLVIVSEQISASASHARADLDRERHRFEVLEGEGWDGMMILDRTGIIRWMGAATARMLRLEGNLAGASILGSIHERDMDKFLGALTVRAQVQRRPFEFRMRDSRGRIRFFDAVAVNHLDDPVIGGIAVHLRDATDRQWAQNALRDHDERFRAGFERSPFASALIDADGHLTQVNTALGSLTGRESSDLLGRTLGSVLSPKDRSAVRAAMQRMMKADPPTYRRQVALADGKTRAELALVPVGDGPDAVRSFILQLVEVRPERAKPRKRVALPETDAADTVAPHLGFAAVDQPSADHEPAFQESVDAPVNEGATVLAMESLATIRAQRRLGEGRDLAVEMTEEPAGYIPDAVDN